MRTINEWFDNYGSDHRNPTNVVIHWICVPAILWAVIALLWLIPVPSQLIGMIAGAWAALAMLATYLFYHSLSRNLGWAMAIAFIVLGLITSGLHRLLGFYGLLWLAIAVFVVAWVGQFIGHHFEGRRPAFLTDVVYLLIGPAWLMGKLMRRMGLSY